MTPTPTSAVAARELAEEAKRWLSDILDSTHSDPSTLYEWQRRCASAIDRLAALAAQPAAPAVLAEPVAVVMNRVYAGETRYNCAAAIRAMASDKGADHGNV